MNHEEAKLIVKRIDVIRAFAEGKEVQFLHKQNTGWRDANKDDPAISNAGCEWRVKPEPREFWLYPVGIGWRGVDSEDKAKPYSSVFKVREVIE